MRIEGKQDEGVFGVGGAARRQPKCVKRMRSTGRTVCPRSVQAKQGIRVDVFNVIGSLNPYGADSSLSKLSLVEARGMGYGCIGLGATPFVASPGGWRLQWEKVAMRSTLVRHHAPF